MQKENEFSLNPTPDDNTDRATPKNQTEPSGGTDQAGQDLKPSPSFDEDKNLSEFDELIKGPYKDAFSKKVQSIINKRFKEQKTAQNGINQTDNKASDEPLKISSDKQKPSANKSDQNDSTLDTLLNAGVDYNTAYSVLHLDEILEESAKRGAELAAKSITDGLRYKAARPTEAVVGAGGYSAKSSVSTLTPEKRKELAKKAMLGEKIGF